MHKLIMLQTHFYTAYIHAPCSDGVNDPPTPIDTQRGPQYLMCYVQLHPIPSSISDIWYLGLVAIKIGCNQQILLLSQQLRKTPIPCSALIMAEFSSKTGEKRTVVLVTGGSGLVGKAIESIIQEECNDSETWIFASSKDGDLRSKEQKSKSSTKSFRNRFFW